MARPKADPRSFERIADWLIFAVVFWTLAASFKTSEVLTVGDWDMWVDWKDREWWPLLYPLLCIGFPALSATSMEQGRLAACAALGIEAPSLPSLLARTSA